MKSAREKRPCLVEFLEAMARPSAVRGPVEAWEFAMLAAILAGEVDTCLSPFAGGRLWASPRFD